MYEAYEPIRPRKVFSFRDMGTPVRRFRGTDWHISEGMSSGATHRVQ